jgi:hypothetical protein
MFSTCRSEYPPRESESRLGKRRLWQTIKPRNRGRLWAGQTLAHPRRSIPRAVVTGLGTLDYGCEDRYAGDGAAACGHRSGACRKAILLINGEFRAETTRCSKCEHLLHDGSVRLDFMTDDVNEAEEMRIQTLASDCVTEIALILAAILRTFVSGGINVGAIRQWSSLHCRRPSYPRRWGSKTGAIRQLVYPYTGRTLGFQSNRASAERKPYIRRPWAAACQSVSPTYSS